MEKILLVMDARKPDIFSIDFACRIALLAQTKLTGLFVENIYFEYTPPDNLKSRSYFAGSGPHSSEVLVNVDTDQSIRFFKEECLRKSVDPEVYIDQGEPIQEVVFESRYADMLVIDPGIGFYNRKEPVPSHFIREILSKAECPVLLTPYKTEEIKEIVFCYNGSASSVFAIKQLTYLLPELYDRKAMLLEVNRTGEEEFNEGHRRMMEWLRAHYSSVYYHALKGEVKEQLFEYLLKKENLMVVIGAYGRSVVSNFFRQSNADVLIKSASMPIFITHL